MNNLIKKISILTLTPIIMFLSAASIASFAAFDLRYFNLAEWDGFCRFFLVVSSVVALFLRWPVDMRHTDLIYDKYWLPEVSTDTPMPKCKPPNPTGEE